MSTPQETPALSRTLSSLDLKNANAALAAVKLQAETGLHYTKETLLSLRPKVRHDYDESGVTVEHIEHANCTDIALPEADGITTPPYRACPNPPPPTPATPIVATPEIVITSADEHEKAGEERFDLSGVARPATTAAIDPDTASAADHFENAGNCKDGSSVTSTNEPEKKKKKKKSSGKNRKPAPTGFEEFYADGPLTPHDHAEEQDLYNETLSFADRIETCIQRYRAKRKLDETRSNILTKYFMLGGIESSNKAFTGGLDKATLEESSADQIRDIQATDYVRTKDGNSKYYDGSIDWVVDFEGVAKGFFSFRVPNMFALDTEKELQIICMVIRNFLNYVLYHNVCPEYEEDVRAARKVCDMAEKELWAIKQLQLKLPGEFNVAASTLFGGRFKDLHLGSAAWATDDPAYEELLAVDQGFSVPEAERIFKTAIALTGTDDMFLEAMKNPGEIIKTERKCYEVVGIERSEIDTNKQYASVKNHEGEAGRIKPLGFISFKPWEGSGLGVEDYSDDEAASLENSNQEPVMEKFWLEDEALALCFVGMKLELDVHELDIGVRFFDTIHGLYCSFLTILPNEKMAFWKEPIPNTRPPPTEEDPDIEERAIEDRMGRDVEDDEKLLTAK